ncbi:universal stress protein [Ruania rhizosphaerae]|uniref:universal stress protein n=1 Tax=Ruania rhizosphaerae TaxID=1840413 RepID=UPI00135C0225|nr:universal stress protein [Ruania rhizosphaerae]
MSTTHARPWHGEPASRPVVVGVEPGQDLRVVRHAAATAQVYGTGLVVVWVDPAHVLVPGDAAGVMTMVPVDPDDPGDTPSHAEQELHELVEGELTPSAVAWRFVHSAGEVARGLAQVAAEYEAPMIVVGARKPGFSGWMNEVIGGSVAGHLVHAHEIPVLVVPLPEQR